MRTPPASETEVEGSLVLGDLKRLSMDLLMASLSSVSCVCVFACFPLSAQHSLLHTHAARQYPTTCGTETVKLVVYFSLLSHVIGDFFL